MQASIHAHYVPACTGPYLSQIGSDQRDQNIYGIRTCWTSGAHNLTRACRLACLIKLCAQRGLACSPYSIDTLISLIQPNLAEIWACACKHIGCMHTSLRALVDLCAQKDPACYPDSIDTLISLIQSNLADIWACACKHIVCMHTSLGAQVKLCAQRGRACPLDSIDILISLI